MGLMGGPLSQRALAISDRWDRGTCSQSVFARRPAEPAGFLRGLPLDSRMSAVHCECFRGRGPWPLLSGSLRVSATGAMLPGRMLPQADGKEGVDVASPPVKKPRAGGRASADTGAHGADRALRRMLG